MTSLKHIARAGPEDVLSRGWKRLTVSISWIGHLISTASDVPRWDQDAHSVPAGCSQASRVVLNFCMFVNSRTLWQIRW